MTRLVDLEQLGEEPEKDRSNSETDATEEEEISQGKVSNRDSGRRKKGR